MKESGIAYIDTAFIVDPGLAACDQRGDGEGHGDPVIRVRADQSALKRTVPASAAAFDDQAVLLRYGQTAHGAQIPGDGIDPVCLLDPELGGIRDDGRARSCGSHDRDRDSRIFQG